MTEKVQENAVPVLEEKTWAPVTLRFNGFEIGMEIRRQRRGEARPFQRAMAKVQKTLEAVGALDEKAEGVKADAPAEDGSVVWITPPVPLTEEEIEKRQQLMAGLLDHINEEDIKHWIGRDVRNVTNFIVDDEPVETGERLYEVADEDLTRLVLMKITSRMRLGQQQVKTSASPSTSSPESTPTTDGSSPATSIEGGAGETSSTAPETSLVSE